MDQPIVTTPSGKIKGSWMTSRRGREFQAYRGIRYAEPPVGELRFQVAYNGNIILQALLSLASSSSSADTVPLKLKLFLFLFQ